MANVRANVDVDITAQDVAALASADALAEFFQRRGYDTAKRAAMTTEAVGIADGDGAFRHIELLSEDPEGFLRVVFAQVRSVTAKARNDLVRALGRFSQDHLIVLTSDFQVLEFVLIDKVKRRQHGPAAVAAYKPVPKVYSVLRKSPSRLDLRILRRLTFTQRDALDQFDKLRSVFEAAVYTGEYYQNRALFADHYLNTRLHESPTWTESPNAAFAAVRQIMADARERFTGKDEAATRAGLIEPLLAALGFKHAPGKAPKDAAATPDYLLKDPAGRPVTAALVYQWDRWLDGPDPADQQTPEENPGASVVSVLERGDADWVIVTNGRLWRLYSRRAHSRSTNFYEVDLAEALVETGETDPGGAFRYWWLFFRPQAFAPLAEAQADAKCWLDTVVAGSRDYAKQVEQRLKRRVFEHIVPHLASGFLADRKGRLGETVRPTDDELEAVREGCLTLLYRLLFLLYAESRDLLPVRESPYYAASLRKLKDEIASGAGVAESEVDDKLASIYKKDQTRLYDRLADLFAAVDAGDPALNVPTYNGGLFLAKPEKKDDSREARIARFLRVHKVPDLFLAQAIDHLSRDPDDKSFAMVFIDYKSLGVRQLGSIYEGLLEFKLKLAAEDLTTVKEKGAEKVIPLAAAKGRKRAEVAVRKGEVYLANDKSERRASGSYYTPDHIVEYIVENTVGPVLAAKLEALRPDLRKAEKTYHRWLANLKTNPHLCAGADPREFAADKTYAEHRDLVDRLFDCKVLDPAMGSGHFLVEAVDFVTDKLLDFLNAFPVNPIATALERTRRSILESLADQGVAVDPDKLTDVHLLKRHVLKRCIYGVDLNPMAVELAKVSLWLDAFTLGAPLSFLDHHLRCGNSLIGATFQDLENAVSGNLLPIEFERMHHAIRNVLTVAAMADATASEVHRSAELFAEASQALSGYKILLDILVARHFGEARAMTLLQMYGNQLDLESADKLMAGLSGLDRKGVERVEAIARPRRFFHWDLEFPECFFGLRPGTERQIEHRPAIEAGFDAIIGNPPYEVLAEKEVGESVAGMLEFFRASPATRPALGGKLNLYKLFIARSHFLLKHAGWNGFIVPMPLLGDQQARVLRAFLLANSRLRRVEAFPEHLDAEKRVFADANLTTCIYILSREAPTPETAVDVRVHRDSSIRDESQFSHIAYGELWKADPDELVIPACSPAEWRVISHILALPWVKLLGEGNASYQGEVNETTDKAMLSPDPGGQLVLRGANISRYAIRPSTRQNNLYLNASRFQLDKGRSVKARHHQQRRVGFQRSAPQNNFRRLIAAPIPAGHYCFDTVSYFLSDECELTEMLLLAFLNSEALDWFFDVGSSNSKINEYRLRMLPVPLMDVSDPAGLRRTAERELAKRSPAALQDEALTLIASDRHQPHRFASIALTACSLMLCKIEQGRQEVRLRDRSRLDERAVEWQNCANRIINCLYDLDPDMIGVIETSLAARRRENTIDEGEGNADL